MDPDRVGTIEHQYFSDLSKLFPIYMDPDRVGTTRRRLDGTENHRFPIYMDPDRVGTEGEPIEVLAYIIVSNLYGSRQSRDPGTVRGTG